MASDDLFQPLADSKEEKKMSQVEHRKQLLPYVPQPHGAQAPGWVHGFNLHALLFTLKTKIKDIHHF